MIDVALRIWSLSPESWTLCVIYVHVTKTRYIFEVVMYRSMSNAKASYQQVYGQSIEFIQDQMNHRTSTIYHIPSCSQHGIWTIKPSKGYSGVLPWCRSSSKRRCEGDLCAGCAHQRTSDHQLQWQILRQTPARVVGWIGAPATEIKRQNPHKPR